MTILLTGVTGAVGTFVLRELERAYQLTLFTRRPLESQHHVVVGDLMSKEDCQRAVKGVKTIVHLAASFEPVTETFAINVLGTYYLMGAAREAGVDRVIFASTNCVYGHCFPMSDRPFCLDFLPIDETHRCRPEDHYGFSKRLTEEMLAIYSRTWGICTVALRLNWVWGTEEIQWRCEVEALDLAKYARYFWAYVDARDAARAFRQTLEAPNLPEHGVYNISAEDHMADEESLELIHQFYPDVELREEMPGCSSFFSWQAAYQAFGYHPQYSWRDNWKIESEWP